MYVKTKRSAVAIVAILSISILASMIVLPIATAHTPAWNIVTHAYVAVFPSPIGVGQTAYIDMWLDKVIDSAALGNDIRFHNYQLTITAPDGTTDSKTFATITDPTSNYVYSFTPTQVGTYTLNFTYPGQVYTATGNFQNDTYLSSTASATLTVQDTQLTKIPSTPLPTEYWTRPIFGTNSNWWVIASNWLGTGAPGYSSGSLGASYPGDAVGSQTNHVMWTKTLQFGGVVGGNNFDIQGDTYFDGSAYNNRFSNPIIINGYLYYREPKSFQGGNTGDTVCVNLQTGKEIWRNPAMPSLSFGYTYDVQDPNQHGVYPPILIASVSGSWMAYDAYTGYFMFNVTNVPTGTTMMGSEGEYLVLILKNYGTAPAPNYYLQEWNSSRLWTGQYSGSSTSPALVPPITNGADPRMYDFNVSLSALNSITGTATIKSGFLDDIAIIESGAMPSGGNNGLHAASSTPYTYSAYSISQSGTLGNQIWTNTLNAPSGNLSVTYMGASKTANSGKGVFVEYYTETMQYVGYSMATGQEIWGPTESMVALQYFASGFNGQYATIADDRLYIGGYSGVVYCYNLDNGNLVWTYGNGGAGNSTSAGLETARPYPTVISAIANGVVYTYTSEHTVETPIYKGALARAINATTGAEIWTLLNDNSGGSSYGAYADGYNVFFNGYDERIYTVGRGPSQTTVSVPHSGLTFGQSVVISGTVIDIAAGTQQTEQAAKLPNGVACASDASMADWMAYVYMQQALPSNFTGVPVTINVIDSNGNYRTIGTTTTDASCTYRFTWTPDISGDYTVIATFAGTNGYYGSYAEDGFNVMNAPTATTSSTSQPVALSETYFVPAIAGIFVLIIIVLALLVFLITKKR